jgi:hypothetical protein
MRRILLVGAALAVVAAIVIAIAGGGGGGGGKRAHTTADVRGPAPTNTAVAAAYLGLTPAELRRELRRYPSAASLADATHGKSAEGMVDAIAAAKLERRANNGKATGRHRASEAQLREAASAWVHRQRRVAGIVDLAAAARYLDMSAAKLTAEVTAGHSLAQIADSQPGKSAEGLVDAIVAQRTAQLEAAVASSRLSPKTRAALSKSLRRRVQAQVQRTPASSSTG